MPHVGDCTTRLRFEALATDFHREKGYQTVFLREKPRLLDPQEKKHKACHNDKQQKQKIKKEKEKKANPNPKEGQAEIIKKFAELGLEPPPDMPEAFKTLVGLK
ncbi:hypothetical protein V6N13_042506 [Hibiscus sabdariffa]|uniref:Uncharacterized protein n=1 Tax=Hibiscus sabdariffa TaxID=183260 RepID=A0ABR2G4C1_9ROSI